MKDGIATEIRYAKARNMGWTKWRPFVSTKERGESNCGLHPERRGVEVSYSTSQDDRVVRCHMCTQSKEKGGGAGRDSYARETVTP